jgi:hypothetical protein
MEEVSLEERKPVGHNTMIEDVQETNGRVCRGLAVVAQIKTEQVNVVPCLFHSSTPPEGLQITCSDAGVLFPQLSHSNSRTNMLRIVSEGSQP